MIAEARFDLEPQFSVVGEDQVAPLRAAFLEHDLDQAPHQLGQHDLARDALRGLDDGHDVELAGARGNRRRALLSAALDELRLLALELLHLAVGAPARVGRVRLGEVRVGDELKAAVAISARRGLEGDGLVVRQAAGAGERDGLLVQLLGAERVTVEPRQLSLRSQA